MIKEKPFVGYSIFKRRVGNKTITEVWVDNPNTLDCKRSWKLEQIIEEDIKENE